MTLREIGPQTPPSYSIKSSNAAVTTEPRELKDGYDGPASFWDTLKTSAHFVAGGAAFNAAKFVGELWQGHKGLTDQPKVTLERPVLFVPGFTTPVDPYVPLLEHLTSEANNGGKPYYVRSGIIYSDQLCNHPVTETVSDDARVFLLIPHTRYDTPPQFAEQLAQDVEAINRFCNSQKSDLVGYSMGGISSRLFLDQGGKGAGKLLMVGTPNQGSRVGSLARWAVKNDVKWAMALANHAPAALGALNWLRSLSEGPQANPNLERLNANWASQAAKVEAVKIIGAEGLPTPGYSTVGWTTGDTAVEKSALGLPGLDVQIVKGGLTKSHETLMSDPDVFAAMSNFLEWKSKESK